VPPANVPGLDASLPEKRGEAFNSPPLRQAAIDGCVLYALWNRETLAASETKMGDTISPWPSTLDDWQWEPDAYFESDPYLRRRFAYWLVLTKHPNAAKMLESHLMDEDFVVRDDALKNLGWLKTPEALAILRKHAARPEPRVRLMAVKGLAHWGVSHLLRFLEDPSHEVRRSVAEELGRYPTRESALALQELQADASPDVEQAALDATRTWPDNLAIPVLLHGMEHASVQTRRESFRELRRRAELEATFPITAGSETRRAAVQSLAKEWNLPLHLELERGSDIPDTKVNRLRVEELRTYLLDAMNPEFPENSARHQLAVKALKESSPDDVPAIETFLLEQPDSPRSGIIRGEVLAVLSPVHAALARLESRNVQERRRAATELKTYTDRQSLSPVAIRTLGQILQKESDALVWRFAMVAILPDHNPDTARIVSWAANHSDSGIRQLAAEFAARHKRPEFADWLLPLLHDSQKAVQLSAIHAAGECGNRIVIEGLPGSDHESALPGLKPLLSDADARVSLASAIAMSRLGDPLGHDELLRLSHHLDERVRLQVIAAMGTSRQTRFVETLIGIGWTAQTEPVKREVLSSLHQLIPMEKHPPALANATGTDAKIKAWAEWWDQSKVR
jgi:HEAT repeat protein